MDEIRNREYLIGIVLDTTLSFTKVYPQVYYFLEHFINAVKEKAGACSVKYGITLLCDEISSVVFADGEPFSGDIEEVIHELTKIEFSGGSADGREDLTGAIRHQLNALNSFDNADKGLIMFSDSAPSDNDNYPDFTSAEPGAYGEHAGRGLRFADFYTYSDDYMPKMRITDCDGEIAENNCNTCICESLKRLLNRNEESALELISRMADVVTERIGIQEVEGN